MTNDNTKRMYGQWAGNEKGIAENPLNCIKELFGDYIGRQCKKKRGYGKDGLYCKQHGGSK